MHIDTLIICVTVLLAVWILARYSLEGLLASLRAEDKNKTQDMAEMVQELEGQVKALSKQVNQDIKKLLR